MIVGFWNKLFRRDKPVKIFDTLVTAPEYVPGNDSDYDGIRRILDYGANWEARDKCNYITVSDVKVFAGNIRADAITAETGNRLASRWEREDLRKEIARLRRNKKKTSHLVAKLKELEESE